MTIAEQFALVAGLRWKILRSSLRTMEGKLEMAARVIMVVLVGLGVLGIGVALMATAYAGASGGPPLLFNLAAWAVFSCWVIVPIVFAGFVVDFDFRNLLIFPLKFPSFTLLSMFYGLLDPPSVAALFWTACIGTGIALARPGLAPLAGTVLLAFTVACLFLNRLLLSWLQKLMAKRRTRELLTAGIVLLMLSVQLFVAMAGREGGWTGSAWQRLSPAARFLPPGAASTALRNSAEGKRLQVLGWSGLLAGYAVLLGIPLRRRLRAQYFGEETGEEAQRATAEDKVVREGWRLPGFSRTAGAMCEKELRYAGRNSQTWMSLLLPLLIVAFFARTMDSPRHPEFSGRPEMFFAGAVGYGLLILTPLLHNTFAFEGCGLQFLLVAPVRLQEVLLAKNLVHGLMISLVAGMTALLISAIQAPPSPAMAAFTFSALLFITLAQLMIGNALSIYFPRLIEFGHLRKRASEINVLMGFLSQIALVGVIVGIVYQAREAGPEMRYWIAAAVLLGLSVVEVFLYRSALDWAAVAMLERREAMADKLCK